MSDFSLQKINLSDESLVHLLNFILSMVKEDRQNALNHHDTLAGLLSGPPGSEGMSGTEIQLLLNDLSNALTSFLKNSAQSTDQAIKVATILANHLTKMEKNASLTDDDRESIQNLVSNIKDTKTGFETLEDIDFDIKDRD